MEIGPVDDGKDDAGVEKEEPPVRHGVIELLDAVELMRTEGFAFKGGGV
jgi:hypothetical protein